MKAIEKQAKAFSKERGMDEEAEYCVYRGFLEGAKSEAAKEFWQRGMYSEGELRLLLDKYLYEQCVSKWDSSDDDWWTLNKKKP